MTKQEKREKLKHEFDKTVVRTVTCLGITIICAYFFGFPTGLRMGAAVGTGGAVS